MLTQSRRPIRQPKQSRKLSYNSQARASTRTDPRAGDQLIHPNQPTNIFDTNTGQLNPLYCEAVRSCTSKALMHVGICMEIEQTILFLKSVFPEHAKNLGKIKDKREILDGIIFLPHLLYFHENCCFLFWILDSSILSQKYKHPTSNQSISLFFTYPQLILTTHRNYQHFLYNRINLSKKLGYIQHIVLFCKNQQLQVDGIKEIQMPKRDKDAFVVVPCDSLDKRKIVEIFGILIKKNAKRCIQELLVVNLFLVAALMESNNTADLSQVFRMALNTYFTNQVQTKHQNLIKSYSPSLPKNQPQLQSQLSQKQHQILLEARKNLQLLSLPQECQNFESTFNNMFTCSQQIILCNRQQIKKQNIQLLEELFDGFLANFDKGRYLGCDRALLIQQDFWAIFEEFQIKAVNGSFGAALFANFIRDNKGRFYEKVEMLQDVMDQCKKNQNFDDIFDKIEIKKKMLFALDKEVKQLELKRNRIEQENEKLKKLERQLELGRLDTENEELFEMDSQKGIKDKLSPSNAVALANQTKSEIKKKKDQKDKNKQKNKWICCNCSIF